MAAAKSSITSVDVALKMAEKDLERDLGSKMSARMKASTEDLGHVDGLRHTILTMVMHENYVGANKEMKNYLESKSEFPEFKERCSRLVDYCGDLVNGVKAKRSFPGIQYLSMSKQQELLDRAMEHYDELKSTLHRIERIEQEVRLRDIRSTVWVVATAWYSLFAVLTVMFIIEIGRGGILPSIYTVIDAIFGEVANFIFKTVGY